MEGNAQDHQSRLVLIFLYVNSNFINYNTYLLARECIILIGPPSITNFTTVKEVDERSTLRLRCEADIPKLQATTQTVSFQWATFGEDGNEMILSNTNDRVTIANHKDPNRSYFFYGTLQLKPLFRVDSGRYNCRISGSVGTSNFSANGIRVNVKCNNVIPHCHVLLIILYVSFYFSWA